MNKVILMGRITRDPEVRYSQGEQATAVARYTLAVDRRGRNQENSADFIQCVAFGKAAEFAESKNAESGNAGGYNTQPAPAPQSGNDGFMPAGDDSELPFV